MQRTDCVCYDRDEHVAASLVSGTHSSATSSEVAVAARVLQYVRLGSDLTVVRI